MASLNVALGEAKEYVIKVKPVFDINTVELSCQNPNASTDYLEYANDIYNITIRVFRTSIVSDIRDVEVAWIFTPEGEENGIRIVHPEKITLTKTGQSFRVESIAIPVQELLKKHEKEVLFKKGSLGISLSIDGLDAIERTEPHFPQWDFSYSFRANRNGYSCTFKDLENKNFTIGEKLEISSTKGKSLPDSYKAYLYMWESDVASNFTSSYGLKIKDDKTADVRYWVNQTKYEVQTNSYIFMQSESKTHYIGCDDHKKINCGNPETFSTNQFEFCAVILFSNDLESTKDDFILIKDFKCPSLIYEDTYYVPQPEIKLVSHKRTENGHVNYLINCIIKNINSEIIPSSLSFVLTKKQGQSFYQFSRSSPRRNTTVYHGSTQGNMEVKEYQYLDENNSTYSFFWPENFYYEKPAINNYFEIKTGLQFYLSGWEQDYRLCVNLGYLVSDADKSNLTTLFSGFTSSKAKSMKEVSSFGYQEDNPPLYKHIGFDLNDL